MDYEIYNYSRGAIVERICTKNTLSRSFLYIYLFVIDMS